MSLSSIAIPRTAVQLVNQIINVHFNIFFNCCCVRLYAKLLSGSIRADEKEGKRKLENALFRFFFLFLLLHFLSLSLMIMTKQHNVTNTMLQHFLYPVYRQFTV